MRGPLPNRLNLHEQIWTLEIFLGNQGHFQPVSYQTKLSFFDLRESLRGRSHPFSVDRIFWSILKTRTQTSPGLNLVRFREQGSYLAPPRIEVLLDHTTPFGAASYEDRFARFSLLGLVSHTSYEEFLIGPESAYP